MRTFLANTALSGQLSRRLRSSASRASLLLERTRARLHATPGGGQAGFMLLEVVVSALLVGLIAIGTLNGFDAAGRVSADNRSHSEAEQLVQQDQERLRGLPATKLAEMAGTEATSSSYKAANGSCVEKASEKWRYCEGGKLTYTGAVFTINSSARFISASKESSACEGSAASANYIETKSGATWTTLASNRPEVTQSSVIAPPTTLTGMFVKVKNQDSEPLSGIEVVLKGTTSHTATTPASGCVLFLNVTPEAYTLSAGNSSYVDKNSTSPPASRSLTLVEGKIATEELVIATPGSIKVDEFKSYETTGQESDTIVASQEHISAPEWLAAGTAGKYEKSLKLEGVFPFAKFESSKWSPEAYKVYAGDCTANEPESVTGKKVTTPLAEVAAGKTAEVKYVEVPPISGIAYEENETEEKKGKTGRLKSGVKLVKLYNTECKSASSHNKGAASWERELKLNTSGELEAKYKPQPYGKFELCVTAELGGKKYHAKAKFTNEAAKGTEFGPIYMKQKSGTTGAGNHTVEYSESTTCPT